MRTLLNIINFIFSGLLTTLAWPLPPLLGIVLIISWPFTRACWEITNLSLVPFSNTAMRVDELYPERRGGLLNTGGTLLNVFWFVVFGWWLCLSHILTGIAQCCTLIGIPLGIANFKLALIAVWPPDGGWSLSKRPIGYGRVFAARIMVKQREDRTC